MEQEFETLTYDQRDGIGRLWFDRPTALNAFDETMSGELLAVLERLRAGEPPHVLVLRGRGESFMAGADIGMLQRWSGLAGDERAAVLSRIFAPTRLEELPFPTIAAVDGYAFGMGFEVALGCDFRIATDRASFALPEITLGVMPGAGGSQRLPRLVGLARAADVVLTGKRITAAQALDWGVVNAVVPQGELGGAVDELAQRLTRLSPLALERAKRALGASARHGLTEGLAAELELFVAAVGTEDAAEGTRAFLEKRRPAFAGR